MEVEERETTAGPAAQPAAQSDKGFTESEGEDAEEVSSLKPIDAQVFHQL